MQKFGASEEQIDDAMKKWMLRLQTTFKTVFLGLGTSIVWNLLNHS